MEHRILVVDDEKPILELLCEVLHDHGFNVETANNGAQAIEAFQNNPHDLVISDLIMPGMSGLEVISTIKRLDKEVEVIILSGYATIDNAVKALRDYNAFDFLTKPLDNLDALLNTIEKALERKQLQKENKSLIEALKQANDELERRVKARTMELALVNERLRKELAERKETEKKLRQKRN
jgi:DNA-binding NtrC family response regulator